MINLIKGAQYIRAKGGNKWSYAVCDSTGSLSGSAWVDGVFREKSKFTFEKPEVKIYDEAGNQVASTYDNLNSEISITSLQDDANLENFLAHEVEDKYFSILMAAGDNDDTNNKIRYIPIARISSKYTVDAPGRRPEITIIPQYNEFDKYPVSAPSWVTVASGSLLCSGSMYYSVNTQAGTSIL